jgi:hypothetical protein
MRANPYSLISGSGSSARKPVSFEQVSQFVAAAMKQHPEIVWSDIQDLADFI